MELHVPYSLKEKIQGTFEYIQHIERVEDNRIPKQLAS